MDVRFGGKRIHKNIKNITVMQNKRLRILSFKGPLEHSSSFYKNSKILKLIEITKLKNIVFVFNQINNNLPNAFENYFQLKRQQHNNFIKGKILNMPQVDTSLYGSNSITLSRIRDWNALHGQSGLKLISPAISRGKVTIITKKWFLNNYI